MIEEQQRSTAGSKYTETKRQAPTKRTGIGLAVVVLKLQLLNENLQTGQPMKESTAKSLTWA
jgi:hypothetical protein